MAYISYSSTTSSISFYLEALDTSYSGATRTVFWYLDGQYKFSDTLTNGSSTSKSRTVSGLSAGTTYTVTATVTNNSQTWKFSAKCKTKTGSSSSGGTGSGQVTTPKLTGSIEVSGISSVRVSFLLTPTSASASSSTYKNVTFTYWEDGRKSTTSQTTTIGPASQKNSDTLSYAVTIYNLSPNTKYNWQAAVSSYSDSGTFTTDAVKEKGIWEGRGGIGGAGGAGAKGGDGFILVYFSAPSPAYWTVGDIVSWSGYDWRVVHKDNANCYLGMEHWEKDVSFPFFGAASYSNSALHASMSEFEESLPKTSLVQCSNVNVADIYGSITAKVFAPSYDQATGAFGYFAQQTNRVFEASGGLAKTWGLSTWNESMGVGYYIDSSGTARMNSGEVSSVGFRPFVAIKL